jgi:hypothetical protein
MRTRASLSFGLLILAVCSSSRLFAQFQPPTSDELKMTADPKAPGAEAVYLNVSEVDDLGFKYETHYARIKVLTEKGKELATVELPYEKNVYSVDDIKARTIQPDGTIVPLRGKPADILEAKTKGYQASQKVFNLPSVQVGSILEYYFKIRFADDYYFFPHWQIQREQFVHKAHYQCNECRRLQRFSRLPLGLTIEKDHAGNFVLDLTDIPPVPDEDWMPPLGSATYKVFFYIEGDTMGQQFWSYVGNNWSTSVNTYIEPSDSFRAVVKGLLQPSDSDLVKAKKLYDAVQSLENTDFTREKSEAERKKLKVREIKRAEDAWTEKGGTRTEIALLYLSMLRAAGLTAYAMRLVDRSSATFIPEYYDYDQLSDTIVVLDLDGKRILLDPGQKMCPFQTLSWRHSMTTGLVQTASGSALATTPGQTYTANALQRTGEVTIDAHTAIDGNFRFLMSGQNALYWRDLNLEEDTAELKKDFDLWLAKIVPEGVEAHVDHFIGLDDPEANLAAVITVKGTLGTLTSKRLLLPALFFASQSEHPFVTQEKRITSVDMHYGEQITDDVTYSLPPGLQVETAPKPSKVPWPDHALLSIDFKTDPGQVRIVRRFARAFTFVKPEDYSALHDFYLKVATADQQQLALTRTPPTKGN